MTDKRYYTMKQVAELLSLSYNWTVALAARGELPGAFRLTPRGRWLVDATVLDRYVSSYKTKQLQEHINSAYQSAPES
ncbi:hypothetical protein LCGC14_0686560 [marine sediment metagenome]|uniref:Helix-turn-helix domain-containing protein n=1 Tax=marine sediment metagenome TaxID=412755 RepID=A0A0F9QRE1_9ZZZZ